LIRYGLHFGQSIEKESTDVRAPVIQKVRHKGLEKLYEDDSAAKVNPDHADKLRRILARLDAASSPQDMDLPGYQLHKLKGKYKGHWAVDVSGGSSSGLKAATQRTWIS
jgi:proteic killer suppression protein